jgi:hypothetical protein
MSDKPKIRHIRKSDFQPTKPQQTADYKIKRHAAGLKKALAEKYPDDHHLIVVETEPREP